MSEDGPEPPSGVAHAMDRLLIVEVTLIGLLIVSYLGINLVADLPRFLIGENITLALLYALTLYLILRGHSLGQPLALFIAAFNAGRVSRSIISPRGEVGELALQHIPLLVLILAVALLALASLARTGGEAGPR